MDYHPIIGISIFSFAIFFSFLLGRKLLTDSKKISRQSKNISKKVPPPKGEITSPDAPWLKESK